MHPAWVALVYVASATLASWLLYRFGALAWYWHALSVLAAFGVGLMPPSTGLNGPFFDLILGGVFLFLVFWGLGGAFSHHHAPHTLHLRH